VTYLSVTADADDADPSAGDGASSQTDQKHVGDAGTAQGTERCDPAHENPENQPEDTNGTKPLRHSSWERQTGDSLCADSSTTSAMKAVYLKGCRDASPTMLYRTLKEYHDRSLTREQFNQKRPWLAKTFSGYRGRVRRGVNPNRQQANESRRPYSAKADVGGTR
jgi:hypothetical protein